MTDSVISRIFSALINWFFINLTIKQIFIKALLTVLRGLILVKRHGGPVLKSVAAPMRSVGLFFVRWIGVPIFRSVLSIRRSIQRVLRPTKHRVLSLVSNRYAVHLMMILITVSVASINFSARDVRAETFGQASLLYQIVVQDDSMIVEVVEAGAPLVTLGSGSSYISDTLVDARLHVDQDYLDQRYISPLTGLDGTQIETKKIISVPARDSIEMYVVQGGDTLGQIAERFGLSLSSILWANNLTYRSTIQPGDSLSILPVDGVLYTVTSGDTLSRIARSYSIDADTIMEYNGLDSADRLAIGDELLLPNGEPPSPVATTRQSSSLAALFSTPSSSSAPSGGWVWPTDWRVITQYFGWNHTGLDIDGDYGTYSYASRGGVVIYSGWRTGYGLTVEIDHGDGYVTRYAHNSQVYPYVGETVSAGQAVAQTGSTGRSTGTHLHFEIIRNGRFQNPLDYIR